MVSVLKDWRFWVATMCVSLCVAMLVRVTAEMISGADKNEKLMMLLEGELDALDKRVTKIETKQHPASAKRYTSDDAKRDKKELLDCLSMVDWRVCVKRMNGENKWQPSQN